ncbi:hypothetical protein vBAbaPP1_115 [Acinetobacter phage vB_AbaM_P1]|nr:hypothetical protein vBAbaPP1_115 [Acinetobacter phage vB_AbaM_P1]WAX22596.1 hypothetical protein [Acinetobacter phage vB_AbaP_HB01]
MGYGIGLRDMSVEVECGELTVDDKKYIDVVEARFSVKVYADGENIKAYTACMTYNKWTKTLDFWEDSLSLSEINIPFSKVEEFRNWLIANGYED